MISKSQLSFVKSLHQKKYRKDHGLFIIEGFKSVSEFIKSDHVIESIFHIENVMPKLANLSHKIKLYQISSEEMARISTLTTPQQVLALVKIPEVTLVTTESLKGSFVLALDGVQDPGNVGTIIRTADWFGFHQIICSNDTADVYNPKVVQASMGSLARVAVHYTDLDEFITAADVPVFGAVLDGNSVYQTKFGTEGVLLLGNEGKGIRDSLKNKITVPVTIPSFGKAESLNVAICASIICSEIRRYS